ncbi:hypothetical protein [Microcystis phage MaeS]|nr:hypothetical protein [Microcystis phage MaeS]
MNMPNNPFYLLNNIRPAGSKKQRVKALLTGGEETGKTTSVLHGAERPLLVFDLEDGSEIYSHAVEPFSVYPSNDPIEIHAVIMQMLAAKAQGIAIPYNSILLDSGTDLYKRIISDEIKALQVAQGKPNKRTLEPKEYGFPNSFFYEIIKGLKKLDVDVYVTAHASDNYLKGDFMKINPNDPVKADVHKDLAHEMDVHIIFKKVGKNRNIKAEIKKSRLEDKNNNPLLPVSIDNVDNKTVIKMIREYAQRDKGFEVEKKEVTNIIQVDPELSALVDEIIEIATAYLNMTPQDAANVISQASNGRVQSPHQLTKEEALVAVTQLRTIRESTLAQSGE